MAWSIPHIDFNPYSNIFYDGIQYSDQDKVITEVLLINKLFHNNNVIKYKLWIIY